MSHFTSTSKVSNKSGSNFHHNQQRDLQSIKELNQFENQLLNLEQRQCTDILCIIVGVAFSVIMIIVSFALFNKQHYIKANFPTDSDGNLCGIDYTGYTYVYFAQSTEISERLCVEKCPTSNDTKLNCKSTKTRGCNFNNIDGFQVEYYQTQSIVDRNGHFCFPTDSNSRTSILQKSKLQSRNVFFNSKDTFIVCSFVAIILSIIFLILVQLFPKIINRYIPYVGAVMLVILIICTWTYPTSNFLPKVIIGLTLIIALVILILTFKFFKTPRQKNGVFLKEATQLIKKHPFILINIPIFAGIFLLLEYILVLQLNSFWTRSNLQFDNQKSLYWQYANGGAQVMTFLWVIQCIWSFFFIKESFNFIISGYAILWYYQKFQGNCLFPYKVYLLKHLGSVIACSFMTGFFTIWDTIFDLIRLNHDDNRESGTIFNTFKSILDLVRPQSLAYVIFSSNSYCNSARYCEYLCHKTGYFDHSQCVSRAYRLSSYALLGGFVALLGLYVHGHISMWAMGIIIVTSYFIINFFLQIHADSADALMIIYLDNEEFAARKAHQQLNHNNIHRENLENEFFKDYARQRGVQSLTTKLIDALKHQQKEVGNRSQWY